MKVNPILLTDGYKTGHHQQYPDGTEMVYSNWTPRSNRHAPKGCEKVVSFGQQMILRWLDATFNEEFFAKPKDEVCGMIKKELSTYLQCDYDVTHFEKLHDLGYLPIHVKSIPEGTEVPIRVPMLTIKSTQGFGWVTNFLETILSTMLWQPMTSATIALNYRRTMTEWAMKTDPENSWVIDWQCHDFSMRGMGGLMSAILSGCGHAAVFSGSDTLPVIQAMKEYYDAEEFVVGSVNATEHSVMCAGTKDDEIGTFRRLLNIYPTGILSVVSDTWDLWHVLTGILPQIKDEVLARDGKLVIRPDSGDPVDIICGLKEIESAEEIDTENDGVYIIKGKKWHFDADQWEDLLQEYGEYCWEEFYCLHENPENFSNWSGDVLSEVKEGNPSEVKGVIELLWDLFGGTVNEQGYKVLNPKIGAIYGDSITPDRARQICERLAAKGFASTNIVLGVGSYTYQYNTRDTFGFAMKATYIEVNGEGREIFKDPATDSGTKKSAKGLIRIDKAEGEYVLVDQVSWEEEEKGELQTIYKDGKFENQVTMETIRERIKSLV